MVEEAMAGMRIQPYIHDVFVVVKRGERAYRFNIFLKNHRLLPINSAVSVMVPGCQWNGDILVMKVGKVVRGVVNLRDEDAQVADFAVRQYDISSIAMQLRLISHLIPGRFVHCAKQGKRLSIPKNMAFTL